MITTFKNRTFCPVLKSGEPISSSHPPAQVPDRIENYKNSKRGISEKCAELYDSGQSLKQISRELKISRTKVRGALKRAGVALLTEKLGSVGARARKRGRQVGAAPYGFCWLRGRLVADPKEIDALRLILSLWRSGKSLSDIARELDRQRIKTRRGAPWKPATVRAIVLRHKGNPDSIEEVLWESTN